MIIPKKIDILGHIYDVIVTSDIEKAAQECGLNPSKGKEFVGCYDSTLLKIYIDKDSIQVVREQTLWHEIIEILGEQMSMALPHENVERLEHGLYYVLSKNKLLKE